MEQALLHRLKLRRDRLVAVVGTIEEVCATGIEISAISGYILELKALVEKLENETTLYAKNVSAPDQETLSNCLDQQCRAEDLIVTLQKNNPQPPTKLLLPPASTSHSSTKLPKLELPKFSGDKLKWMEFWDRFRANIDGKNITGADKFSYLIGCLTDEALDTVLGLSITDDNYEIAVEALQCRFGSKDTIVDAHYTELCNLKVATDDSKSCRSTISEIERHLRVLEKLGEPVNGNNLRAMVLRKFPAQVVHELHLIDSENTMSSIRQNLNKIIIAKEKSAALLPQSGLPSYAEAGPSSGATTEALQVRVEPDRTFRKRKREPLSKTNWKPKKSRRPCLFCKMTNHTSENCRRVSNIEARKQKLQGRCLKCLRRNHRTEECRRRVTCYRCNGPHFQLLCPDPKGILGQNCSPRSETVCNVSNNYTFLQTAVARVRNPQEGISTISRIILDCGSQRSYITQGLANALKLHLDKIDLLLIYTFGSSTPHETSSPSAEIIIQTKRGVSHNINVNVVPHITDRVPKPKLHNSNVDLYADDGTVGEGIDILIGNDFYWTFIREKRVQVDDNLYLIDTDFGYVFSGNVSLSDDNEILSVTTYCECHTPNCPYFSEPDLPLKTVDIRFLWSLESIGITDSPKATRQEEAVRHFNETVQYHNGRYQVKWPWIEYPPDLPSNFGMALGRLRSVLKRLDPISLDEYNRILKEQLELGIIEIVNQEQLKDNDHPIHYLAHHMVKQKGKTGRIVYDASAKTTGQKSLNECLYSGPSMLEDLTALLLKFRTKRFGMLADVEKAFLQVALQEEDRDVTRFLWLKDVKGEATDGNLLYLRFCRVPFGVISSPFLLTATIRHHMGQSNESLLKSVADKCYVDNLVTGADTLQEAREIYAKTRTAFEQLAMNIRDWVSNNQTFVETIPEEHQSACSDNVKVLGLKWNILKDNLSLNLSEGHFKTEPPVNTKRKVLRALARVYDPCGFVCPLVLSMKIIFQQICEKKVKWDTELPTELTLSVKEAMENLKSVLNIEIPRYMGSDVSKAGFKYQLHCFTDASKEAYAAVVYLKVFDENHSSVSFLIAKSHVSQTKDKNELKIPRLELLGFLIGSRLLKYVRNSLELEIHKEFLWSDSLVVLSWMRSSKLLPPFVANRIREIKQNHPNTEMCYINTKSNPADIATRPELFTEKKDLWYNGPDFLPKDESHWPENRHYETYQTLFSSGEVLGGSLGELISQDTSCAERGCQNESLESRGSPSHPEDGSPEGGPQGVSEAMEYGEYPTDVPMELDSAQSLPAEAEEQQDNVRELVLEIKKVQSEHFKEELAGKITHLARNLDLFVDADGLLRCRGRMANTDWSFDMKYPILLPKNSEFTNSIIKNTHESNYHVGASHTLNIIRERYWIPQGKPQVAKIIRKCPQCIKHGGGPYRLPATPALPPERVNYNEPFTYTGLDYMGPVFVSTASGKEKRWIALFTCLTVRAIHLEVVKDLSADECLLALRRFAATRYKPKKIYSDNATCFKLVSEVVQKPYCIQNNIQWKFTPQLAPWHGGFYERLVALVKHCLKRTLEKHLLNDSRLATVVKEVESVLNTRPLTRVGTEVEHILRPADFLSLSKCLTMEPSVVEATTDTTATKADLIAGWKRGRKILEEFKRMFISQYLASLRERYNHAPKQPRVKSHRAPRVGDLVQIKSDQKNRDQWKVGKIDTLIEGCDGQSRVAQVKVGDSTLTRSIGHLYPLEVDDDEPAQADAALEVDDDGTPRAEAVSEELPDLTDKPSNVGPPTPDTHEDVEEIAPDDLVVNGQKEVLPIEELTKEQQGEERDVRSKRSAAIRAREKILEWTRHLLVLLR